MECGRLIFDVACHVIAINFEHGIDMQQLFAQLAVDLEKGEQWWLTPEEEAQAQLLAFLAKYVPKG